MHILKVMLPASPESIVLLVITGFVVLWRLFKGLKP